MKIGITQKQIGQRIAELRKVRGLSQEELSKMIGISRPSLTQIELGKRNIDVLELKKFSIALEFSLSDFLSDDFAIDEAVEDGGEGKEESNIRISVPSLNVAKFKNVLLYLLEKCAGKPNVGDTVLNKLLYFADFNYYEIYEEHLTGASYKKLQFGPVPYELKSILAEMVENKQLQRVKTKYHDYSQTRYLPLEKADLTRLKASEKEVIDKVVEQMSDWNANKISEYSHQDKPWRASKDGETISYNLVFYRRPPFSVREYSEDE